MMRKILKTHFPDVNKKLAENAIEAFYDLRNIDGIEKKPATRELINWVRALEADPDFQNGDLIRKELPYLGVLFKKSGDYQKSNNIVMKKRFFA